MRSRALMLVLASALAVAGCKNMTGADLASRVLQGGIVASQGLFISDVDEVKIGMQTTAKVLAEMPEHPNPELRDYVNAIGQKMAAQSVRTNLKYQFRVVESRDVNAFAAPGGFIFVTTPALRLMKNEAELAGVLGHEVAHVDRKHSIGGIQRALLAQGVAVAVLQGNSSQLTELGANVAATLILKGFDRDAELESDRLGAQWAFNSNYDARALGGFLDTLRQTSGDVPAWLSPFSDHPRTDDRLDQLNRYFTEQQMDFTFGQLGQAEFKARVLDLLGPAPAPQATPAPGTSATPEPVPSGMRTPTPGGP